MDMLQNSDEWFNARLGTLTASNVHHIIAPSTLKPSNNGGTRKLSYELAAQRMYGVIEENSFQNWEMERGHIEEDIARDIYSEKYAPVKECGFIENNSLGFKIGFSPDGLVGEDGIIEIKSRIQKLQFETIIENKTPSEYMLQIQTGLLVTGRAYCDFVSFSNGLHTFVNRVLPKMEMQTAIITAAEKFECKIVDAIATYKANTKGLFKHERVIHAERDTLITSSEE